MRSTEGERDNVCVSERETHVMSQLTALCTSGCDGKRNGDCEFAHYCGWFFFAFPTVCLPADNVPEVVATIAKYERAREPLTASPNTHVFISRSKAM